MCVVCGGVSLGLSHRRNHHLTTSVALFTLLLLQLSRSPEGLIDYVPDFEISTRFQLLD